MIPLALNAGAPGPETARAMEAAGEQAWLIGVFFLLIVGLGLAAVAVLAVSLRRQSTRWPARERILLRRPWFLREAAGVVIWMSLWYAALFFLAPLWKAADGLETLWVVVQSGLFNLGGLWLVSRSLARRGLTWRQAFGGLRGTWTSRVGAGALYYLAAMPFIWFYSILYQIGLRASGYTPDWQDVAVAFATESSGWVRLLLFLLAVGLAPIFEEIFFRGILLTLVARRWGTAVAVVAVSALFAAVHGHLPSLLPLFLIAVAFSLGYIFSGSLLVPVTMHALFNGINLVMLGWWR
ncbi:MAG TPA: CPBP family intramembrane metalloprotease [Kiritimatiellia bacterium]|nr:CPBP family intramembrane metalloprotease [Kiritimatiellia bacterium]HSA18462.1 CPBP family intramembrane metalloprotease [Kiritimatiellia bacterium]